jgi:hypothetical protein
MQFDEQKTLNDVLETNFVMNFNRLANNGVILGIYRTMKKAFGHVTMDNMQMHLIWLVFVLVLYINIKGIWA